MQKLLEDRDKNVREETKQLVVEMYRWAGPALKPQMAGFKPVLVSMLLCFSLELMPCCFLYWHKQFDESGITTSAESGKFLG